MFDATEVGRKLAEAAEEAAKSMQRLADVLREAEKEADSDKFWKFHVEKMGEMSQAELIKARAPKPWPYVKEDMIDALNFMEKEGAVPYGKTEERERET